MNDKHGCSCGGGGTATPVAAGAGPAGVAGDEGPWFRSRFHLPGMDCPAEEQMIRLRLSDVPTRHMAFDIPGRSLVVDHAGDVEPVIERLIALGYGAELQESRRLQGDEAMPATDDAAEAQVLGWLLGINALMFVVEMLAGWWADSAGLISDAADMFADAAVYGVALYAVGRGPQHKLSSARLSGLLQLALAVGALSETGRRVLLGSAPEEAAMIGISLLALAANVWCLTLISGRRDQGVHMRASYIFSANDVLANLGVMVAGVLVTWSGSPLPDWIIGFLIGAMVFIGALRILRLR